MVGKQQQQTVNGMFPECIAAQTKFLFILKKWFVIHCYLMSKFDVQLMYRPYKHLSVNSLNESEMTDLLSFKDNSIRIKKFHFQIYCRIWNIVKKCNIQIIYAL